ncbi:MAG: class I SAM-dependent methyltransferase [Gammaproteobacteria bacterium]|nr:class I SAM-dependent methyltransferase [Gammaproteobacteria bacterium]
MDITECKQMIKTAFDAVADTYDHPSLAFFPDTAERLLSFLDMDKHSSLLDVCTGTGMVALKAAAQLSEGSVAGIDLSPGMLKRAGEKARQLGLTNAEFLNMDLDQLQFDDRDFDLATCSFGLFFIDDMEAAMKNITAVVKPGGRIAISSFTGAAFEPFSQMFLECYESFGKQVPPLSWKRLDNEDNIRAVFSAAGISQLKFYFEPLSYPMKNEQHWWDVVWNAGYRGLLNQLTGEQQEEFKNKHLADVADYCNNNNACLNTDVVIAIGIRT